MKVETKSELVVDRSRHGELLRINFNMSFPQLSCEFATVDVSDALGTVRLCILNNLVFLQQGLVWNERSMVHSIVGHNFAGL